MDVARVTTEIQRLHVLALLASFMKKPARPPTTGNNNNKSGIISNIKIQISNVSEGVPARTFRSERAGFGQISMLHEELYKKDDDDADHHQQHIGRNLAAL